MKYISTRGRCSPQNFEQVLLTGLAPDGGLFVPETLPTVSVEQIRAMGSLSYADLALDLVTPFVDGEIPTSDLKTIIDRSYEAFDHPEVAPMTQLSEREYLLELYHGPTLAFKDFALQVLGRLLDYVLERNDQRVVILGATSGDTGSAALEGCRHSERVEIYILHPYQRVSDVQRKQMTTVPGKNVFNLAIEGNFDDCQRIVKAAFADQSFLPNDKSLVAVNSINWARILMQIVYYFYSALKLGTPDKRVSFSVPTGNFGDIYAGYLAKCMGLPIDRLIVATNKNDILQRVINTGEYKPDKVKATITPSMDIQVASNFERLLYYILDESDSKVGSLMSDLSSKSLFSLEKKEVVKIKKDFEAVKVTDEETISIIDEIYKKYKFIIDPHTATGIGAAKSFKNLGDIVVLGTAHPYKFNDTIKKAIGKNLESPEHLKLNIDKKETFDFIGNSNSEVKNYILGKIQ